MSLVVHSVQVHLIDQGAGMPTLFLHGNPDSAELWRPLIERMQLHVRCLAPDLPGFARSLTPRYADTFGAAEVQHVPDCGHWLPAEDPETVAAHLQRFPL